MPESKVAVVTGGEKGIGRAITERLAKIGWDVVVAGVDEEAAFFLQRDNYESGRVRFIKCDVSDETMVQTLFKLVRAQLGHVDGLILNAGISSPARVPLDQLDLRDWQRVLDVNLTGSFLCAKYAAPLMRAYKGSMVMISSTRASMSEANTFAYSASKGAIVSLAHSMAVSLGPDIRVNAISPGWIHTGDYSELSTKDHDQHAVGRVGHPDDVSAMVLYLLSPESGFITGQNFSIDGGMTKQMIYRE